MWTYIEYLMKKYDITEEQATKVAEIMERVKKER